MKHYTNEEIREFIKCPQFGDEEYGLWGALPLAVRETLLHLVEENELLDQFYKLKTRKKPKIENPLRCIGIQSTKLDKRTLSNITLRNQEDINNLYTTVYKIVEAINELL